MNFGDPKFLEVFEQKTAEFEGLTVWPYLDVIGKVTVGFGCLIDPVVLAVRLPWRHYEDPELLSKSEVRRYWNILKKAPKGEKADFYRKVTPMYLKAADVRTLFHNRIRLNVNYLNAVYDFDSFSEDARLGIMFLVWATGCGFDIRARRGEQWAVHFNAALLNEDWRSAAAWAKVPLESNPTGRYAAIVKCFKNAIEIDDRLNCDPCRLYYPESVKQRTLRYGHTGEDVRNLRDYLHFGPDISPPDRFDGAFYEFVKLLQQSYAGLEVDGIVGPKTRAAIGWGER